MISWRSLPLLSSGTGINLIAPNVTYKRIIKYLKNSIIHFLIRLSKYSIIKIKQMEARIFLLNAYVFYLYLCKQKNFWIFFFSNSKDDNWSRARSQNVEGKVIMSLLLIHLTTLRNRWQSNSHVRQRKYPMQEPQTNIKYPQGVNLRPCTWTRTEVE